MNKQKFKPGRILQVTLIGVSLLTGGNASALVFSPALLDGTNGFTANGPIAFDFAANAVSSAGDINGDGIGDVMVGAYGEADSSEGNVYVIFGQDTSGPGPFPASLELTDLNGTDGFVINGVDSNERVGTALVSVGDINNDGVGDILIGAHGNSETNFNNGAAYVVFGRYTTQMGISFPASFDLSDLVTGGGADGFVMYGVGSNDNAGESVAGGFDLNGDGINDLAIGAHGTDVNGSASGEVYVIFGRDTGVNGNFSQTQTLPNLASGTGSDGFVLRGISVNARAGTSVASVGDINDDGFDDLIIGSTFLSDATAPGQAYVIFGRDTSVSGSFGAVYELSTLAAGGGSDGFVLNGLGTDDALGDAVGAAGDVDGDGIDDLIVGDPNADNNGNGAGQAYVVFGRDTAMVGNFPGQFELSTLAAGGGTDGFVLNGRNTGSSGTGAGRQVGSAGDFNGDGVSDLFVGDRDAAVPDSFAGGEVYIVFGRDTGVVGNFDQVFELGDLEADSGSDGLVIQGQDDTDRIGGAVALAGDANNDGHADLIIGAPEAGPNGGNSGEAYVIYGPGRNNTPPVVTAPVSLPSLEDNTTVLGAGVFITDGESDAQNVSLSIIDTLAMLHLDPVAGVAIGGNDTAEMTLSGALADINAALQLVEVVPLPDVTGSDTMIIRTTDGFFVDEGFLFLFFQPVNDPPVLTVSISPVEVLEDGGEIIVEAVITGIGSGDPEQLGYSIIWDETNDNNALFDFQPNIFNAEFREANVYMELNPDVSGSATVDFTATDNRGTANGGDNDTTGQFEIIVLPVNDPPVFVLPGNVDSEEDATQQVHQIFVTGIDDGDPDQTQALMFSSDNDNPGLFSEQPVIDSVGNFTYTSAPDAHGIATVTVTLSDDGGTTNGGMDSSMQDFTITITPLNDPPTFTAGNDVDAMDTDGPVSIPAWATAISPGPNESDQMVNFLVTGNTAPELFSAGPAVAPDGTLSFTPALNADGSAMVEIVLMDDGPGDGDGGGVNVNTSDPQSFMITIELATSADLSISKDNGTAFIPISPVTVVWFIVVENLGTEDVIGAEVQDFVPGNGSNGSWNCTPFDGATCTASGIGDLIDIIDLPAGSRVEYNFFVDFTLVEGEVVENTAVVIPPELPVDRNLDNNTATDRDPFALYFDGFESDE